MNNISNELEHLKHLATPFYFEGSSEIVLLLVHGLTASPTEMLPLGKFLHKKNYTVYGIRLAGHGTDYKDLPNYTWQDWYQTVEDGFFHLRKQFETIIPIGISMGAVLVTYLIHKHQEYNFSKLILLAPAFGVKSPLAKIASLVSFFIKYYYKGDQVLQYYKDHDLYAYYYYPMKSISQFNQFLKHFRNTRMSISSSTLIAYGNLDNTISLKSIERTVKSKFDESAYIEIVTFPNSGHNFTTEPDAEELFQAINSFLNK